VNMHPSKNATSVVESIDSIKKIDQVEKAYQTFETEVNRINNLILKKGDQNKILEIQNRLKSLSTSHA
jgi:hypothetical protein